MPVLRTAVVNRSHNTFGWGRASHTPGAGAAVTVPTSARPPHSSNHVVDVRDEAGEV